VNHIRRLEVSHHFPARAQRFICVEILYVSDEARDSHYREGHWKNGGDEKTQGKHQVSSIFLLALPNRTFG
jgi:hypothetical protein